MLPSWRRQRDAGRAATGPGDLTDLAPDSVTATAVAARAVATTGDAPDGRSGCSAPSSGARSPASPCSSSGSSASSSPTTRSPSRSPTSSPTSRSRSSTTPTARPSSTASPWPTATASRWRSPRCPKPVQEAHIAAEDRTFYENNGISVGGILRAVKTSVTGDAQVGGSTITQQYVKNYFLTQDRTLDPQGQGDPHRGQDRRSAKSSPRSSRSTSTPSTTAAAPTASRAPPRPTSARTSAS